MALYRLVDGKVVLKNGNEIIVNQPGNPLWTDYQNWLLDNNNTPDPAYSQPSINIPYPLSSEIPDLANSSGSITDIRHGNKSNGSLHAIATTTVNGFLSNTDKTKLDGVANNATFNQSDSFLLTRTNHLGSQPASTITGLGEAALLNVGIIAGTVCAGNDPRLSAVGGSVPLFTGATGVIAGITGTVPPPIATDNNKFLRGDGTWQPASNNNSDSFLLDRTNHTGFQSISTITNLQTTLNTKENIDTKTILIDYKKASPTLLRSYPMFSEATNTISTNTNNNIFIAGRVIYLPFIAIKTGTINNIVFAISAIGATTTSSFRAAIYSDNGSLYPNALIATGTDLTGIAAAGVRTITINASVIKNTLYWLGFNLVNTAGTAAHTYRAGVYDNLLGLSPSFSPYIGYNTIGQSTTVLYLYPSTVTASQPLLDGGFNYFPALGYSYST